MQTIGDKIRILRQNIGMSQTELADKLHITNQAISKWENNTSDPTISLLPDLAAILGVSIDDLFEYTDEKAYEQIDNMIEIDFNFSNGEFMKAEAFLMDKIKKNPNDYKANSTLGDLYISYASILRRKAVAYGKKALEIKPNQKFDINTVNNASNGVIYDWNVKNHNDLIAYYQKAIKASPENKRMYLYLIDNLIDDGRLEEAKKAIAEAKIKTNDNMYEYYDIFVREKYEGFERVYDDYLGLTEKYNKDWRILFAVANNFSQNGHYDKAIPIWEMAFNAQAKPRYTDHLESIAQCYTMLGDKENAIRAYEKELDLLKTEWNETYGFHVDRVKGDIEKLRN